MAFQKKQPSDTSGDTQTRIGKEISAKFASILGGIGESEASLNNLKLLLKTQSEQSAESEQERSRSHEAAMYQLAQERQVVVDRYAREDQEREQAFSVRHAALIAAEDALCTLLGIPRDVDHPQTGKAIELAFNAKISAVDKEGQATAFGIAKGMYEGAKKLDAAEANTASALLKQENDQLKRENAALMTRNQELSASQQKTVDKIAEVAAGAFSAAGGVVAKGNDALGTAAGSAGALGRNR